MRIGVLRSLVFLVNGLLFTGAAGTASASQPIDLRSFPIEYGYASSIDGRGSWMETAPGGEWRVTAGAFDDGSLTLQVEVEAPEISIPLEPGPAVLLGTLVLRGGRGEVGSEVAVRRVTASVLPACADSTACTYAGSITLPTELVPRLAARHPGRGWYLLSIDLTLVRTFAQGTWLQVLPLADEDHDPSGGSVGTPTPYSGRFLADGAFPVAQRIPWEPADQAVLARVERLRRSVPDASSQPVTAPLRVDVTADACAGGWTIASPTGDTILDIGPGAFADPMVIEVPVEAEWTAYVPSLSGVTFAREAFAYGPHRVTGPTTITGTLTGGTPDCVGYTNGEIAWTDDAPVASPAAPHTTASPEAVLHAYLAALLAGDCETARTFATETFTVGSGELCGGATVEDVRIHPTGPARPSEDEVVFATTLTITGGDASMPDGEQPWFYVLGRQPDGSWRLTGGGSGP